MVFDFVSFLDSYRIDYRTQGPNVKKGNVNINCPFCALPDSHHSSHHLGIDVLTGFWGCWRDRSHRGRRPHRLIMKLIGCTFTEAKRLVGDVSIVNEDSFKKLVDGNMFDVEDQTHENDKWLTYPKSFRKFDGAFNVEKRHSSYLRHDRGFLKHVSDVCDKYSLRYCINGDYSNRIIFPFTLYGRLVTWTARSIYKREKLRYKNLEVVGK